MSITALTLAAVFSCLGGCADPEALAAAGGGGGGGANVAPSARFTTSCTALACSVDATTSSDGDGSIVSYAWTFGDGAISSGAIVNHSYAGAGSYTIRLTVTDDASATGSAVQTVTVTAAPGGNNPPSASFAASCTDLACSFDAGSSSDADGTIASYDWDFGDTSTGAGVTINHSYAAAGTYDVTLTVIDDAGAVSTTTQTLSVASAGGGGGGGVLDGKTLYDQNCAACHGADGNGGNLVKISVVGATADSITNAIATKPQMSSLSWLTAQQIQAIANYLGTLVVGTTFGQLGNTWAQITLTDASGSSLAVWSDPNTGNFIADASALSGPLMATAYFPSDGTSLYGYSTGTGTVNITPLTTEVLQIASGDSLTGVCAGAASGCFVSIAPASLAFAQSWVALEFASSFEAFSLDAGGQWMNQAFDTQWSGDTGMAALILSIPIEALGN